MCLRHAKTESPNGFSMQKCVIALSFRALGLSLKSTPGGARMRACPRLISTAHSGQNAFQKRRSERSTRSSNRLPAPSGLRLRFRRTSRNLFRLENDLFRLESQGNHALSSGIQGQAEAVVVRTVRRIVRVAVRRPAIRRVGEWCRNVLLGLFGHPCRMCTG